MARGNRVRLARAIDAAYPPLRSTEERAHRTASRRPRGTRPDADRHGGIRPQREAAERAVAGLFGVRNVKDDIEISYDADPVDVTWFVQGAAAQGPAVFTVGAHPAVAGQAGRWAASVARHVRPNIDPEKVAETSRRLASLARSALTGRTFLASFGFAAGDLLFDLLSQRQRKARDAAGRLAPFRALICC